MSCESRVDGDVLQLAMVNDTASVDAGQTALRAFLSARNVSERGAFQTELAFEELAVNVVRHAYAGRPASQSRIDATVRIDGPQIVLTIEDAGLPFDPVQAPEVPLATSLEQAQVGGLGIRFIRAAAAHITHERVADKNRTTVWLNR